MQAIQQSDHIVMVSHALVDNLVDNCVLICCFRLGSGGLPGCISHVGLWSGVCHDAVSLGAGYVWMYPWPRGLRCCGAVQGLCPLGWGVSWVGMLAILYMPSLIAGFI